MAPANPWHRQTHGTGKPEALKGDLTGFWSRRITAEHRLVYAVEGKQGADPRATIAACRYHYRGTA